MQRTRWGGQDSGKVARTEARSHLGTMTGHYLSQRKLWRDSLYFHKPRSPRFGPGIYTGTSYKYMTF